MRIPIEGISSLITIINCKVIRCLQTDSVSQSVEQVPVEHVVVKEIVLLGVVVVEILGGMEARTEVAEVAEDAVIVLER